MMLDNLKRITDTSRAVTKPLYLRNLLKEEVQNYILNFVYNRREYKDLIFTGGTCLRKVYNLPRLSEDLDFDFVGEFKVEDFAAKVKKYFGSELQYKDVTIKISSKKNTIFIKLPILKELGLASRNEVLFVRCDFSLERFGQYDVETSSISTAEFTFFVRNYDLATLFANKITAFLQREFFRGAEQTISYKSRDVFDLVWFLEKSRKSDGKFEPNWPRLVKAMGGKSRVDIIEDILDKITLINEREIKNDLNPFVESTQSVTAFSKSFKEIIVRGFTEMKTN